MSRKAAVSPQLQAFQSCRKAPCEGDHKPDVLAYLVLNSRDIRAQRVEHGGLCGGVIRAESVARLSDGVQLGITIRVDLGNDLSALELAHNSGRVREESALVHLHGVQAERTASVLGHGEGLICEVHGALAVVAVVITQTACRNAGYLYLLAAGILHLSGVCFHPAGSGERGHLLVQLLLEQRRVLNSVDCHISSL